MSFSHGFLTTLVLTELPLDQGHQPAVHAPLHIGPLRLWTPMILAPMAGVTDAPFRRLCRQFGERGLPEHLVPQPIGSAHVQEHVDAPAGLYVTEMVTSRALVEGNPTTLHMIRSDPLERVRSIQLYGVDPSIMGEATRILVERDLVDHIDLNFGCPVPKVTRKGGGAALPWKRDLLTDLLRAVVHASQMASKISHREHVVPITIKMRIGIDDDHLTYLEAGRIAENAGISAVALHARTQEQYYSGRAQWEVITRLKESLSIPILGNGDVFSGEDAMGMLQETGCDGVVVGRGCQGRPWLFEDLVSTWHGEQGFKNPTLREVVDIIETHARWEVEDKGNEPHALREMRSHIGWYLRGFAVGGEARRALNLVSTLEELHDRLHALDLEQVFPDAAHGARGRAGNSKKPHLPEGWLNSVHLSETERKNLHLAEDGVSGG